MSSTADHVFPREIFQVHQRGMLPKVPSCKQCNNKKSELEHYLLSVLPFGATHANAQKALAVDTRKRLEKNRKLHNKIKEGFGYSYIPKDKYTLEKRLGVKFDCDILHEFVGYTCKGLMWHHWNRLLPKDCKLVSFTPSESGVKLVTMLSNLNSGLKVNTQLGGGTVRYRGIMSEIDEGMSVWGVQLFGGITVLTAHNRHRFNNSFVAVITGSPEMIDGLNFEGAI
jgi:hypothetical protein